MKKQAIIVLMLIFSFVVYGDEKLKVNKIEFYGTFVSPEYLDKKVILSDQGEQL